MSATINMTPIRIHIGLEPCSPYHLFGLLLCGCEFNGRTCNVPYIDGAVVGSVSVYDSVPTIALLVVAEFSRPTVVECALVALFEFACFHVIVPFTKVCFTSL